MLNSRTRTLLTVLSLAGTGCLADEQTEYAGAQPASDSSHDEAVDAAQECPSEVVVQFRALESHDGTAGNSGGYGDSFIELVEGGDVPPLLGTDNGDVQLDLYYRAANPVARVQRTLTFERDGHELAYVWHDMIDQRDEVDIFDACYFTNHVGGRLRAPESASGLDVVELLDGPVDLVMETVADSGGATTTVVVEGVILSIVDQ